MKFSIALLVTAYLATLAACKSSSPESENIPPLSALPQKVAGPYNFSWLKEGGERTDASDRIVSSDKADENQRIMERISEFCSGWEPPPTKGYGWDYASFWADFRDSLLKFERRDLVRANLLKWAEKPKMRPGLGAALLDTNRSRCWRARNARGPFRT